MDLVQAYGWVFAYSLYPRTPAFIVRVHGAKMAGAAGIFAGIILHHSAPFGREVQIAQKLEQTERDFMLATRRIVLAAERPPA